MESTVLVWKKYLGYTFAILAILFAYSWIMSPMIVSVTGVGEVSAPAETATLTFTLSSNADTPQNATPAVKSIVANIKANFASSGIAESDIFESQITVLTCISCCSRSNRFSGNNINGDKNK